MTKRFVKMKLKIAMTERPCLERPHPRTHNLNKLILFTLISPYLHNVFGC